MSLLFRGKINPRLKLFAYQSLKSASRVRISLGLVTHNFSLSTQETETGGSLSSKPAWSTWGVLDQLGYAVKEYWVGEMERERCVNA